MDLNPLQMQENGFVHIMGADDEHKQKIKG